MKYIINTKTDRSVWTVPYYTSSLSGKVQGSRLKKEDGIVKLEP